LICVFVFSCNFSAILFRDLMLLFFIVNIFFILSSIETLWFSRNHDRLFIECARSIIIKNHYWFLSEFYSLLKSLNDNSTSIENQQIPFDQLYLILKYIQVHCDAASKYSEQNQNLDEFYRNTINRINV